MLRPCPALPDGCRFAREDGGGGETVTFNTFNFALTNQKKSANLSVLARQALVIRRWINFLGINILSFTSCCNETIRVGEHRGGVCDQFIVPVCISYRQGPHTVLHTTHHTTPPSYHPASQHFFPTVGYFPSGLTVVASALTGWPCCWMPGMTQLVTEAACLQITDQTRQPS